MEKKETKYFVHDILNDAKQFRKTSFKTVKIDDATSVVYGIKDATGKECIHKIMTKKTK